MPRYRDPTTGRFISTDRAQLINLESLNTEVQTVNRSLDTIVDSLTRVHDAPDPMGPHAESMAIAAAVITGLNAGIINLGQSVIQSALDFERQQISLQAVTGSIEAADAQYRRLLEVARLPGINISQALGGSAQLQAIGLSGAEAAEAIGAIGNALATSGQSAQEMRPIISGFRQLNAEGKILQEDLAIITTRIPAVIPLMREAFGGTRAEDVRRYYTELGRGSDAAELFSDKLIELLQTLPSISETASNALENLSDTANRLQGRIGDHLLPLVKDAATGIEGVLQSLENSSGTTRAVATIGSAAGVFTSLTSSVVASRVALQLLRPALGFLTAGPLGIATLAVSGLVAAFVAWRVATSDAGDSVVNLNTFIARNTELLRENEAAVESGTLAEIRASAKRVDSAREAASERLNQLRDIRDAQFEELQGIRRGGEAYDELTGSLRRTGANLANAEAELERLNGTLRETNAEVERLEQFEQAVGRIQTAISKIRTEIAGEGLSISTLLGGETDVDIDTPQANLAKLTDELIRQQDAYNQLAAAARGGDEASLERLVELQNTLRNASQQYFQALQQGLVAASTEDEYDNVIRLSTAYGEVFGNVAFLSDFVSAFDGLAVAGEAALEVSILELEATKELADEYERLNKQTETRRQEAERALNTLERNQIAAVKALVAEENRAYQQRIAFTKRQLSETAQALKVAGRIERDLIQDRTDAEQDAAQDAIDARREQADASVDAADRVTDRWLDSIDEITAAREKADREDERREQQAERRRERQAEREARQLERIYLNLGTGIAAELESAFDVGFLQSGIRAALGDPSALLSEFVGGLFDSLSRPDLTVPEHLRPGSITEGQLFGGGIGQTESTPRFFNDPSFQTGDFGDFDLAGLQVPLFELQEVTQQSASQITATLEKYLPGIESNTRETTERIGFDRLTNILDARTETLERLLRTERDSPLQDLLDNRQGILRLFSAEKIDEFLVGANQLIEAQNALAERQILEEAAPEELNLLDNLALLLRNAGDIDIEDPRFADIEGLEDGLEGFIARIREALVADAQGTPVSEQEQRDIVGDLNVLLSALDVLPETADAFSTQLAAALDGSIVMLDPEATAALDPEATAGVDPNAEVGVDPTAQVELEPGSTVELQAGTFVTLEDGTVVRLAEDQTVSVGEDSTVDLAPGTVVFLADDQMVTLAATETVALAPGTVVTLAEGQTVEVNTEGVFVAVEDTSEREIGVQDTAEREIGVQDTAEREIGVADTSERRIGVDGSQFLTDLEALWGRLQTPPPEQPQQEAPIAPVTEPTPAVAASAGIVEGETFDESLARANVGADALRIEAPVDLSDSTISKIASAVDVDVDGASVFVTPKEKSIPVSGAVKADVEGHVTATLDSAVQVGNTVDVRIVDIGLFIDAIADQVSQRIVLGDGGFPAG